MKIIYLLPAALLLTSCSRPTTMEIGELKTIEAKERTISVTGSSETFLTPDDITLSIDLSEYYEEQYLPSAKEEDYKTLVKMEKLEADLMRLLNAKGVPKKDIKVDDVNTSWRYYWKDNHYKPAIVQKTFRVKLHDIETVDNIVRQLNMKGVSYARITSMKSSQDMEMRRKVKADALKAAKEKAKYLLDAVGKELGDIVNIVEVNNDHGWYGWGYSNGATSNSNMSSGSSSANSEDVGPRAIKLRYEVNATFTIK